MIRYKGVTDEGVEIEQLASRPTLYLDNWALNLFSDDHTLGCRFTGLLNELGGTLAISVINVLEVGKRSDTGRVSDICGLLDSVDGVFISIDPARVSQKEEESKNKYRVLSRNSPCADLHLLEALEGVHDPLKPFKISEVVLELARQLKDSNGPVREGFETELSQRIRRARNNKTTLLRAKNRFRNRRRKIKTGFPHTQDLYDLSIDFIVINEGMKMPDKEWLDLFHCIVPVTYCDFVLIDGRWTAFVRSTGLRSPEIASVYNRNELENFLRDLEGFSE